MGSAKNSSKDNVLKAGNPKAGHPALKKDPKDPSSKWHKYDLHIHSHYSPCGITSPEDILRRAKLAGLDGIAITDHDTMKAYPILKKLNKDKDFEIIPGMEISTQYGDVLALYLREEIKTKDFFGLIREIKKQGGMIIIPHPYTISNRYSFRYPFDKLKDIAKKEHLIIAVEVFNSRNFARFNKKSKEAASKYGFTEVASSDAHIPLDIGQGYTMFKGDLRTAIHKGKTKVGGSTPYNIVSNVLAIASTHVFSRFRKLD